MDLGFIVFREEDLPPLEREVIRDIDSRNYSPRMVARHLKMPLFMVMNIYRNAHKRLCKLYNQEYDPQKYRAAGIRYIRYPEYMD